AGPQSWMQAESLVQCHASARKPNTLTIPETEIAPSELYAVKDAVKAARLIVGRIAVARGVESGHTKSLPILVDGRFHSSHLRIDSSGQWPEYISGYGIGAFASKHFVNGV